MLLQLVLLGSQSGTEELWDEIQAGKGLRAPLCDGRDLTSPGIQKLRDGGAGKSSG